MKIMPYLLFLKKQQKVKLSSAANYSGALKDKAESLFLYYILTLHVG